MGEVEKFVPLSPKRVRTIDVSQQDIVIQMTGVMGEKLNFFHLVVGQTRPFSHTCVFGLTGVVELRIFEHTCIQK